MKLSLVRRHCSVLVLTAFFAGSSAVLAQAAKAPATSTLLVLGDSLSAEYGLQRGQGWVALLEARLKRDAPSVKVVNASISGDTTSGGRSRLPALLTLHKPDVLVIELGGNDALRGLPIAMTQDNLQAMTQAARASGAKVLLVGMQVPPNYGPAYTRQFADMFVSVAKANQAELVPFMLKGIADVPDATQWFQADRIHPLAKAHPVILQTLWPPIKKLLRVK